MRVADRMQRPVVFIQADDSIETAARRMRDHDIRHLPVLEDRRLVGVVSERDLLRRWQPSPRRRSGTRVADVMSAPARVASPTMSVEAAASLMAEQRLGVLPVVGNDGAVVGVLSRTDVLRHTAASRPARPEEIRAGAVDEVMTRGVVVVVPGDTLSDAATRMREYGVRHLPVVDGEARVVGLLCERDVERAAGRDLVEVGAHAGEGTRLRVRDAMTADPYTVTRGTDLLDVLQMLVEQRMGALPVVDDDDRLVGIVSYVDVLAELGPRLVDGDA